MKIIIDSMIGQDRIEVEAITVPRMDEYIHIEKGDNQIMSGRVIGITHEFHEETHTIFVHLD